MFTWGYNNLGQLGKGHNQNVGDDVNEMGNYLDNVKVGSGRTVVDVQGGDFHTCALLDNYEMKCWGSNSVFFLYIF